MKSSNLSTTLAILAALGAGGAPIARVAASSVPGLHSPTALAPATQAQGDPDIEAVLSMITGSMRHPGSHPDTDPALRWNAARVNVDGLDNAVYVEITREDSPSEPFRQSIAHAYRRGESLALRFFEFAGNPGLPDAATGLWLAPEAFIPLSLDQLRPSMDLTLERDAQGGFSARTLHPALTTRIGAVEITSEMWLAPNQLRVVERGSDAAGRMVWGRDQGEPLSFTRTDPGARVQRLPGGLITIDLTALPEGGTTHVSGGEVAVHYTGWLTDGTRFDTSRQNDRPPMKVRIPGQLIQGWNDGLADIALGMRRRIIIPPALGYGERGAGRGLIPPNATLIFDVECVWLDNTQPPPPPPPPGQPGAPAAPTPQQPR